MAGPFVTLPPTIGVKSIANKLGLGVRAARNAAGSLGSALSEAGSAFMEGANGDRDTSQDIALNPQKSVVVAPAPAQKPIARPGVAGSAGRQGGDVTLAQKYGRGVTSSIRAGAYQDSPGYGQFGSSGPRSAAQIESDDAASRQLEGSYGARMAANEALAPRPQEDSLRAKVLNAQYEQLMPAQQRPLYSTGDTLGSFTKRGNGFTNESPGLTLKDEIARQQMQAKNASGMLELERGRLAGELESLKSQLDQEVMSGRRSKVDADALYARSLAKAQELSGIMKPGFPPPGF